MQNSKVQFKIKKSASWRTTILLTFYFLLLTLTATPPVLALEATKSASPSADVKAKLKVLQDGIASKAAKLTQEVRRSLSNRAYIGTVAAKSGTLVTLSTPSGPKLVKVNEFTEFVGKKFSFELLGAQQQAAALGDVDEEGVLTARRVIRLEEAPSQKQVVWGVVIQKDPSVLKLKKSDGGLASFLVNPTTVYRSGSTTGSYAGIRTGQAVIVVATTSGDKTQARFVYTKAGTISVASPSAKISPSQKLP